MGKKLPFLIGFAAGFLEEMAKDEEQEQTQEVRKKQRPDRVDRKIEKLRREAGIEETPEFKPQRGTQRRRSDRKKEDVDPYRPENDPELQDLLD